MKRAFCARALRSWELSLRACRVALSLHMTTYYCDDPLIWLEIALYPTTSLFLSSLSSLSLSAFYLKRKFGGGGGRRRILQFGAGRLIGPGQSRINHSSPSPLLVYPLLSLLCVSLFLRLFLSHTSNGGSKI